MPPPRKAAFSDPKRLPPAARRLIQEALREDLRGRGDVTTLCFVPPRARLRGRVVSRRPGVLAGAALAAYAFGRCGVRARLKVRDGAALRRGQTVLELEGGPGLLTAERTALNILGRLSGIATLTRAYVREAGPRVYDTRKTTPLWRDWEKYAVACGGGKNHRFGLFDAAMVKDNHWAANGRDMASVLKEGAERFRRRFPGLQLEVEVDGPAQLDAALACRPDVVLLDNHSLPQLRRSIARIRGLSRPPSIEVSGGVTLATIGRLARLRPDRISVGRLTHSAPALDFSLEMDP